MTGLNGVNYVADVNGSLTSANSLPQLAPINVNSIAVTADFGISASNNTVYFNNVAGGYTENDSAIGATISQAASLGLGVMVRPLIDFLPANYDTNPGGYNPANGSYSADAWRSYFNPGAAGSAGANSFFASYQAMIIDQAKLAQANGAATFCIGTELDQLTGAAYKPYWDSIIGAVRGVFSGKLTYAAEWDDSDSPWQWSGTGLAPGTGNLATQVSFWSELDYVGIDEYAPISDLANPTLAQLVAGWTQVPTDPTTYSVTGNQSLISYYQGVSATVGKPLLFTEIGFANSSDAASSPATPGYNVNGAPDGATADPTLQANLYKAFYQAWAQAGNGTLAGYYWWDWEPGGAGISPFSPQGNQAALTAITAGSAVSITRPVVSSITTNSANPNNAVSEDFTVTFSEAVTGVTSWDFALTTINKTGGNALTTAGISSIVGGGTTYVVTVGGVAGDGVLRLDLKPDSTGITDASGNSATAAFANGQSYIIEHTPPSAIGATAPTNGVYGVGAVLTFTVSYSEPVTVTGAPRIAIALTTGGTAYANYVSGSGASTLSFLYGVAAGQQALGGIVTATSIDLNGGFIRDAAGNNANLAISGVEPPTSGVIVDASAPQETVAQFLANQAALDTLSSGFAIVDSASDIAAAIDALNADPHILSLTFTDATAPTLALNLAQTLGTHPIASAHYAIDVVDTAARLAALTVGQIATLAGDHVARMSSWDASLNYGPAQGDALKKAGIQVVTPAGDHVREGYSDGSAMNWFFGANGVVTKLRDVHADGSVDVHTYAPGLFHGTAYASIDVHATAAGFNDVTSFDDAQGAAVMTEMFTSLGGGVNYAYIINADGTREAITTGFTGQSYTAYSNDITSADTQLAHSLDNADGSGNLRLLGSNLVVSTFNQTIGQVSAPGEFTFNNHSIESFQFVAGTNDRITFDAPGFGTATVKGFGVAGTNDIVDLSHVFGTFGAAQGAMTQVGSNAVITEGADTITFLGLRTTSLTAAMLGY